MENGWRTDEWRMDGWRMENEDGWMDGFEDVDEAEHG